jgi:hypothetical protein
MCERGNALLCFLERDDALSLEIDLVADNGKGNLSAKHLAKLLHPILHLDEAVVVGDVVDKQCSVRITIINRS